MNEQQFINEIADIIEADPAKLSLASKFREEADLWSSMTGFVILNFLEEKYKVTLPIDKFLAANTIGDLFTQTQLNKGIHTNANRHDNNQ